MELSLLRQLRSFRMSDDTETILTQSLASWSNKNVFVGDQSELRANVKLPLLTTRICFSTFFIDGKTYTLPTNDGYIVYRLPRQFLRGIKLGVPSTAWRNAADYLNVYQVRLLLYDNYGKLFPLSQIYIKEAGSRLYIAVTKSAFLACATEGLDAISEIYLTLWANPHPENPVTVREYTPSYNLHSQSWAVDAQAALSDIYSLKDTDNNFITVHVNGVYTPRTNVTLNNGDYVSIVIETDILCKYETTIDDNLTGYESDLYQNYREILHMPKSCNPKQYLIPHDSIDVYILDSDSGKGLYQSRYDYRSVRQVTHQDYSINRSDADSLRDALHATTIKALTVVRNPNSSKTLKGDRNYIKDLYKNSDSDILLLLRGVYVSGLDFWKASVLEQSPYISLLFTNTIKSSPSDTGRVATLADYLDSFGYYNTLTILNGGVELGIWDQSTLVGIAPASLVNRAILPYVYINGRKLLSDEVSSRGIGNNKIELSLLNSTLVEGDNVSVIFKDFTPNSVDRLDITSDNTVYSPKNGDYRVYSYDDGLITTVTRSTSTYRTDVVNGSEEITFYPQMYGKTVYVHYSNSTVRKSINIDDLLKSRSALLFTLEDADGNPVVYYNSLDVFVNGYWAVKGVDYFTYTDTTTGKVILAISNRNFLDIEKTGNTVEWFTYGDTTISDDFDYVIDNKLKHTSNPYLFERNVSEVYVEGVYIHKLTDNETYLETTDQFQASVGEHILRFPYTLCSVVPSDLKADDTARLVSITNFFKRTVPSTPDQIVMNEQHQVYSVWIQYLITKMISGELVAVNDPDEVKFIKQFPDVNGLKTNDPTLSRSGRMNKYYLAIAAAYTLNMPDTTVDIRTIVQKLITLCLVRDLSSLGVTPV